MEVQRRRVPKSHLHRRSRRENREQVRRRSRSEAHQYCTPLVVTRQHARARMRTTDALSLAFRLLELHDAHALERVPVAIATGFAFRVNIVIIVLLGLVEEEVVVPFPEQISQGLHGSGALPSLCFDARCLGPRALFASLLLRSDRSRAKDLDADGLGEDSELSRCAFLLDAFETAFGVPLSCLEAVDDRGECHGPEESKGTPVGDPRVITVDPRLGQPVVADRNLMEKNACRAERCEMDWAAEREGVLEGFGIAKSPDREPRERGVDESHRVEDGIVESEVTFLETLEDRNAAGKRDHSADETRNAPVERLRCSLGDPPEEVEGRGVESEDGERGCADEHHDLLGRSILRELEGAVDEVAGCDSVGARSGSADLDEGARRLSRLDDVGGVLDSQPERLEGKGEKPRQEQLDRERANDQRGRKRRDLSACLVDKPVPQRNEGFTHGRGTSISDQRTLLRTRKSRFPSAQQSTHR